LDSGLEREYYYDEIARLDYCTTNLISKSSATQRAGRAGRVKPGFCFKMYTEEQERRMDLGREMEILRTDIKDVLLYSYKLSRYFSFGDLLGVKEIQTKDPKKIQKVTNELFKLGALTTRQITLSEANEMGDKTSESYSKNQGKS
jgi:HrpA-like RNA helicase